MKERSLLRQLLFPVVLSVTASSLSTAAIEGHEEFEYIDYGIAAPVSESRGAIATLNEDGQPIVLALVTDSERVSLLVINALNGETEQYYGHPRNDSFSMMLSSAGRVYTMFGPVLHEFDVKAREWSASILLKGGRAFSYAEGADGKIYAGLYPSCHLIRFNPETKEVETLVKLHNDQKYPLYLQVAKDGWVYAGVGPAKSDLVAYHPETGELRSFGKEYSPKRGYGRVWRGKDGQLYGTAGGDSPWLLLSGGAGVPVDKPAERDSKGSVYFQNTSPDFGNGWTLAQWDAMERRMVVEQADGSEQELRFDYESKGANITSLAIGPNGQLHGSTAHPMYWFTLAGGELISHGHIPNVGGGNISAFAAVGNVMYGAAYNGGYLYAYDMNGPWNVLNSSDANPQLLETYGKGRVTEDNIISRPRTLHRHGDWIIMGGFPGYGLVGGGLAFFHPQTGESIRVRNQDLIAGHSTTSIKSLNDRMLVGVTSTRAPGGGKPIASGARIYLFDWESKKVIASMTPVPDEEEIRAVQVDASGQVFGMTNGGVLFVFDPQTRTVTALHDLTRYGKPLLRDQSLLLDDDGRLLIVLSEAVLRVEQGQSEPVLLKKLPVEARAGSVFMGGRLYIASGAHVWSVSID